MEINLRYPGFDQTMFDYNTNNYGKDIIIAKTVQFHNDKKIKNEQLYKIVIENIDEHISVSYYHKDNEKWNLTTGIVSINGYIDFSNAILNNINKDNKTKFFDSYDTLIHIEILPELLKSILGKLNDLLYFDKGDKDEQSINEPIDQLVSN